RRDAVVVSRKHGGRITNGRIRGEAAVGDGLLLDTPPELAECPGDERARLTLPAGRRFDVNESARQIELRAKVHFSRAPRRRLAARPREGRAARPPSTRPTAARADRKSVVEGNGQDEASGASGS